jgi:starch synthase (maltosyl-transferring)
MPAESTLQARPRPVARAPSDRRPRIVIQYPQPSVDLGRYPAKRCVGDSVNVSADIFGDGHDLLRAVVRYRPPGRSRWREAELCRTDAHLDGVRWGGWFDVDQIGRWEYTIEAWQDGFGTWRDEIERKVGAGQTDLNGELSEGRLLIEEALNAATSAKEKNVLVAVLGILGDDSVDEAAKTSAVLDRDLEALVERIQPRHGSTELDAPLAIEVDRLRARYGAWYELFPRSWGGLEGVERQLPALAELGFDVIYLAPIHPIGETNRKGANNALVAAPGDPGSPWAIGGADGGHDAVHRDLGTKDDLARLTEAAREHGLEIALDFAIQASADHPWLTEHPEWFHHRPDGTLKYAENPPKRYQDIYNFNWETKEWRALWGALLEVLLGWVECGVKVFRVDNPHTKPFAFWQWLIEQVHKRDRDVVFLAEAFTRRAVMRHLAKVGFSQSYTYFTWKNSRWELSEYIAELARSDEREYFRPNFFANTPDILHAYLQHGGRPAFEARLVLAATLSPSYGIYSGYESFENEPAREGSEEYLHSEKYEIKERALDGPLLGMITRINEIRRSNPAFGRLDNIEIIDTANDALMAYVKRTGANTVITVVNLDPLNAQAGAAIVPASLGLPPSFAVRDLLADDDDEYSWRIGPNYVRLEPGIRQAHVMEVLR